MLSMLLMEIATRVEKQHEALIHLNSEGAFQLLVVRFFMFRALQLLHIFVWSFICVHETNITLTQ